MLEVVPYELDEIKKLLKQKAIEEYGLNDAEFEGSHISQLINLIAYATVVNNTNFTFGLNEMFITQAHDRRNVIKHARQMGYKHKRNVSYQYKIKLKIKKPGEVTLNKYSTFKSGQNNYIFLGDSITDFYGTYTNLRLLSNEYNNNKVDLFLNPSVAPRTYVITEEGLVAKILLKEINISPKFLLEPIGDNLEIPTYSQIGKDIYVEDGLDSPTGSRNQGWRNFIKVGTVDTYVIDKVNSVFKIQMTLEDDVEFPFPIIQDQTTELNQNGETETVYAVDNNGLTVLSRDTFYTIYSIESLIIVDGTEEVYVPLENITLGDNNITFYLTIAEVEELHSTDLVLEDTVTHSVSFTTNHDIIDNSVTEIVVLYNDNEMIINSDNYSVDYNTNNISLDPIIISVEEQNLLIDGPTSSKIIPSQDTIKDVESVRVFDNNNEEIDYESLGYTYEFNNDSITFKLNGVDDTSLNGNYADIKYVYYLKTDENIIKVDYSYNIDILNKEVKLKYKYTVNENGYLAKRIFMSDLRGERKTNENAYDAQIYPDGWDGFYASSYSPETNILYFPIGKASQEEIDSGLTAGNNFHNPYVEIDGETKDIAGVLTTPFKRTRFSITEAIWDPTQTEIIGYKDYDKDYAFACIDSTYLKNEIEIIVKEGVIRRWNDLTDESIKEREQASLDGLPLPEPVYKNPELTVIINESMVEAGYFTIRDEFIEDTGIEMYVTRVLDDGTIVYDEKWEQRDYLLAEETETDLNTFVSMTDVNYEDFINIYTRYAGTGTKLSLDMTMRLNILTSSGPEGATSNLIEPDDDNFEAKYYIEETLTPVILHIAGSEIMSTDSIRETAPLFSNTANRAVTKQDYKTICEAQPYIEYAQIWGGEEETPVHIPGHIFFSIIPYSRPTTFDQRNSSFVLRNVDSTELFFPSYYQITGRDRYDTRRNSEDQEVLFNLLDNYKIITLQLDYTKTIYLDYCLNVEVLKYRFGQTVAETNVEIHNSILKFFVREIEKYDSIFYKSSLVRHIDNELGDKYGISLKTNFSVDLYDNIYEPDKGTFTNSTKNDLSFNTIGLVGDDDLWKFIMPLSLPIEDLFEDSIIVDGLVQYRGRMIVDHITNCNTPDFIIPGDFLYMELDDGTFISHNKDGVEEDILANAFSEVIEINIIYTKNYAASKEFDDKVINPETGEPYTEKESIERGGERFKVGSYTIHRTENIIRLELNTHNYWHLDAWAEVTEKDILNLRHYWKGDAKYDYSPSDVGLPKFYQVDENGEIETEMLEDAAGELVLDENENPIWVKKETLLEQNPNNFGTSIYNIKMPYSDSLEKVLLKSSEGVDLYHITSVPMPRTYFTEKLRKMFIRPKGDNMVQKRNVFSRLREVNFIL